jgi:hypothetical protein
MALVVADESYMRGETGEAVPTRKRLGVDQDPGNTAVLCEVVIGKSGEAAEVLRGQGARRRHAQNALRFDDRVFEHMASPGRGR